MDSGRFEGMWKRGSGNLRAQWGMLTSDRTGAVAGTNSQLADWVQDRFGRGAGDFGAARDNAGFHQPDSAFVLVAYGAGGRWDVYAKDFDTPLASFDKRQAACKYAGDLAIARNDSIVPLRHRERLQSIEAA